MGKKSTNAVIAMRVEEVLRIRIDGAQWHDIQEYARAKGWNLSPAQVGVYIRRADDLLVERQDKSRRRLLAKRFAQRDALFAKAVDAADYRTALAVLSDADKLRGLYPAAKLTPDAAAGLGELLRGVLGDSLRDRRAAAGGSPAESGGAGESGPAPAVADAPAPAAD